MVFNIYKFNKNNPFNFMQLSKTERYKFLMFELFSTLTVLESVITEKKLFGMSKLDCSYLYIHIALAF